MSIHLLTLSFYCFISARQLCRVPGHSDHSFGCLSRQLFSIHSFVSWFVHCCKRALTIFFRYSHIAALQLYPALHNQTPGWWLLGMGDFRRHRPRPRQQDCRWEEVAESRKERHSEVWELVVRSFVLVAALSDYQKIRRRRKWGGETQRISTCRRTSLRAAGPWSCRIWSSSMEGSSPATTGLDSYSGSRTNRQMMCYFCNPF